MHCRPIFLCACLIAGISLVGCAADAPQGTKTTSKTVAPPAASSPHKVMVSLAEGAAAARDQQDYLVKLQEQIGSRWRPAPDRLKYTVGIELTISRPGLCCNTQPVSSMGSRKEIEACRDAILSAGTFDPLPPAFKSAPQTFFCEFLYNPPTAEKADAASNPGTAGATTATTSSK